MRRTILARLAAAAFWLAALVFVLVAAIPVAADNARWGAGYFPNVVLTTQDGARVRFYDDLIKGRIVAINLIYTTCKYACPLETARLAQVARVLGDRMGRDVFFYSITIDPDHDTPEVLKEYAAKYQAGPGWTFLTGKADDIEAISRKLGLYSEPNPSNPDGHTPMLIIGNEATGQWMRNSALDNPKFLARTIGDWLNSWQTAKQHPASYADVPTFTFDRGEYTFRNHCAACHTIGRGDHLGPDLAGVTATRDRDWLTRFIVAPDKVVAGGDPIARTLLDRYKQVLMPNLGLGTADADVLIDYIDAQSRAVRPGGAGGAGGAGRAGRAGGAGGAGGAGRAGGAGGSDMVAIVGSYLPIQRALSADTLAGVSDAAHSIAIEAARLGADGVDLQAAAGALQQAGDLKAARTAFAALSDAVVKKFSCSSAACADVSVAYCPMAHKYWLQKGDTIQNPFYGLQMSDCGRFTSDVTHSQK